MAPDPDSDRVVIPYRRPARSPRVGEQLDQWFGEHRLKLIYAAWGLVIATTAFKITVIAYAMHRSPTWPWARFHRNVGDPDVIISIVTWGYAFGVATSFIAAMMSGPKRWAAILAVAVNALLWFELAPASYLWNRM